MIEIAQAVHDGATDYLTRPYRIVAVAFAGLVAAVGPGRCLVRLLVGD